MQNNQWEPDIVVGIDFGMTYTGVAWSRGPAWPEPKTIQHWPGKTINELANKVPTLLQYMPDLTTVNGWGFLCDQDSEDPGLRRRFKLHLDPSYKDARLDRPTTEQARKYYSDYLRGIHDHLAEYFSDVIPAWKTQRVEFVFSVPTTWKNPSMIAEMEQLLKSAGFENKARNHRAKVGLTEAEAAAVYAAKQQYKRGDVLLICDAGGGTTDVNILKVMSGGTEPIALKPLSWVEGQPLGSINIDRDFHALIADRLSYVKHRLDDDPANIALGMLLGDGRFERFKCSYGSPGSKTIPKLLLPVPLLPKGSHYPHAVIEDSSMIFSRDDLKGIFESVVNKLLSVVDEQLDRAFEKDPDLKVSYVVLSGGLGSSTYVKDRLRSHYTTGPGSYRPAVEGMKVAMVEEPQLAVVQGLVIDRIQSITLGTGVLTERCCRQSYGIVCSQEFQQAKHQGQKCRLDPRDGKFWVDEQIEWFIKQGITVPINGVTKSYSVPVMPGTESQPWQIRVVMSDFPPQQLPTNLQQRGSRPLCNVSSVVTAQDVDKKLKNRQWYKRGMKYWRIRFDVKAVVGAADLKFVLLSKDKKVISEEHNAIEVKWQTTLESASDDAHNVVPSYLPELNLPELA